MPYCVVAGCVKHSRSLEPHRVFYHSFPNRDKSPKRFAKWVEYSGRQNYVPSYHATICSKHFNMSDYEPSQLLKLKLMPNHRLQGAKLKPGSVPSVPLHKLATPDVPKSARAERYKVKVRKRVVDSILKSSSVQPEIEIPDAPCILPKDTVPVYLGDLQAFETKTGTGELCAASLARSLAVRKQKARRKARASRARAIKNLDSPAGDFSSGVHFLDTGTYESSERSNVYNIVQIEPEVFQTRTDASPNHSDLNDPIDSCVSVELHTTEEPQETLSSLNEEGLINSKEKLHQTDFQTGIESEDSRPVFIKTEVLSDDETIEQPSPSIENLKQETDLDTSSEDPELPESYLVSWACLAPFFETCSACQEKILDIQRHFDGKTLIVKTSCGNCGFERVWNSQS